MIRLTRADLVSALDAFISERVQFEAIRRFVFRYFDSEENVILEEGLEEVFAVLGPYIEYEEANGDEHRLTRMLRLRIWM